MLIVCMLGLLGMYSGLCGMQQSSKPLMPLSYLIKQSNVQQSNVQQSQRSSEEKKEREAESEDIKKLRQNAEKHIASLQALKVEEQKIMYEMQQDKLLQHLRTLPRSLPLKICSTYFEQIKMLAARHRLALLPAVFAGNRVMGGSDSDDSDDDEDPTPLPCKWYLDKLSAVNSAYENYKDNLPSNAPVERERFIINGILYCRGKNFFEVYNPADQSCVTPHALFGFSVPQSSFALLGWSDGKSQIVLHRAEQATLENLSYDQLMWISSLYGRRSGVCSDADCAMFASLSTAVQECLRSNYALKFPDDINNMFAEKIRQLNEKELELFSKEQAVLERGQELLVARLEVKKIRAQLRYKMIVDRLMNNMRMYGKKTNKIKRVYF